MPIICVCMNWTLTIQNKSQKPSKPLRYGTSQTQHRLKSDTGQSLSKPQVIRSILPYVQRYAQVESTWSAPIYLLVLKSEKLYKIAGPKKKHIYIYIYFFFFYYYYGLSRGAKQAKSLSISISRTNCRIETYAPPERLAYVADIYIYIYIYAAAAILLVFVSLLQMLLIFFTYIAYMHFPSLSLSLFLSRHKERKYMKAMCFVWKPCAYQKS